VTPLVERVSTVLESCCATSLVCDTRGIAAPDAVTIDALARLQLAARHHGRRFRLDGASPALRDLLAFVGLDDVMLCNGPERGQTPSGI
jgi:anti-anti-sigma regulatory factor